MPNPGHPSRRYEAPPGTGAPFCCPYSAQSQLLRACAVRLLMGPHTCTPCAQRKRAASQCRTPQGREVGGGRVPHPGHPSRRREVPLGTQAPSWCPYSAQSQLLKACAVGLVTGPHPLTPCTQRKRAAGPGRTPHGPAVGGGRVPHPGHPSTGPRNREGKAWTGPSPPLQPTSSSARDSSSKRGGSRSTCNGPTSVLPGDLARCARNKAEERGEARTPQGRPHTYT